MYVVHATFRLDGITVSDYLRHCDEVAPEYAAIPGLHSKIWLVDPENSRFGAVYVYEDEAAYDDFRASEFFQKIAATPFAADVRSQAYHVLDGPTQVTRGPSSTAP